MKKLFVTILLILTCSAIFGKIFIRASYDEKEEPQGYKYYASIQIKEGDSLWSIAAEYAPSCAMDKETYVKELKAINKLHKDTIHAGQYLTIFYYSEEKH